MEYLCSHNYRMYSVHQHWDPLKTCIVGRNYPPEFYSFISDTKVRSTMERIAIETEEDYQSLIKVLESFGVTVLRPVIGDREQHIQDGMILPPPSTPRDYTAMIGDRFFIDDRPGFGDAYKHICDHISEQGNSITKNANINSATVFRIGKDLYCGAPEIDDQEIWNAVRRTNWPAQIPKEFVNKLPPRLINDTKAVKYVQDFISQHHLNISNMFPDYRCHFYDFQGHIDGCFCAVKPGLIISLRDIQDYSVTFPGWQVVYLEDSNLGLREEFDIIKHKNKGRWWVPGEERNEGFIQFVEQYLPRCVGLIEETVFDVNSLVIDQKNVICTTFSDEILEAYQQHGINPIPVNVRHRYLWDGGLHCMTSDIHRESVQQDWFPQRSISPG